MTSDEPAVVRILREYREALELNEMIVMEDMGWHWLKIEAVLQAELEALAGLMAEKAGGDAAVTLQILRKEARYRDLLRRVQQEIEGYNGGYLVGLVEKERIHLGMIGVDAATEAIRASYAARMAPWFPTLNKGAVEAMAASLSNLAPLYELLKAAAGLAVDGLTQALMDGIAQGLGVKTVAANMAQGMGLGLDRALLIARTEMMRAYRAGSTLQYRESRVVSGYRRLVKKGTACMACLMLDGELLSRQDELQDHPAGKCQAVPVVIGAGAPKWVTGKEYFLELSAEEQMARMGIKKFELWQDGVFRLEDLAVMREDAVWGKEPRVATIAELGG